MEADDPVFVGSSSGEPTTTMGEVDDLPCAGTFSGELAMTLGEADGSSSAGNSSDELAGKLRSTAISSPESAPMSSRHLRKRLMIDCPLELVQVCRKWCFQGYRVSVPYLTSI